MIIALRTPICHQSMWGCTLSEVTQSCLTLCHLVDCSPPGSSVHGILEARILEWVAISFPRGSSQPRDRTQVSRIAGRRFNLWATREECNEIKRVLNGNLSSDPSTENKPTAQLLRGTKDGWSPPDGVGPGMKWPGVRVGSPRLPSFGAGQTPGSSGRSLRICLFPRPPPLLKGESSFPSCPFGQSRNWKELLVPNKLYIAQRLTAGSPASGLRTAFRSHTRTIVPVSRKAGGSLLVAFYACGIDWNSPLLGEEDVAAATIFQKGKRRQVAWITWGPAPPSVHCRAWRSSCSLERVFRKLTPTARGAETRKQDQTSGRSSSPRRGTMILVGETETLWS